MPKLVNLGGAGMKQLLKALGLVHCYLILSVATAAQIPPLYHDVAKESRVPAELLYAIAQVESGGSGLTQLGQPWPWTLNIEGKARYYKTRLGAWFALAGFLANGAKLIDVGLMQVNWYYHQTRFLDAWLALEPKENLRVAAGLLRQHYDKAGSWTIAAGMYHAPYNLKRARRYKTQVLSRLSKLM